MVDFRIVILVSVVTSVVACGEPFPPVFKLWFNPDFDISEATSCSACYRAHEKMNVKSKDEFGR